MECINALKEKLTNLNKRINDEFFYFNELYEKDMAKINQKFKNEASLIQSHSQKLNKAREAILKELNKSRDESLNNVKNEKNLHFNKSQMSNFQYSSMLMSYKLTRPLNFVRLNLYEKFLRKNHTFELKYRTEGSYIYNIEYVSLNRMFLWLTQNQPESSCVFILANRNGDVLKLKDYKLDIYNIKVGLSF